MDNNKKCIIKINDALAEYCNAEGISCADLMLSLKKRTNDYGTIVEVVLK